MDVQRRSLTHDGLQLGRSSVAELLDAGEVLQQSQSLDAAHPGDLLDHTQHQRVQQLKRSPPPERVVPTVHVDLETRRHTIDESTLRDPGEKCERQTEPSSSGDAGQLGNSRKAERTTATARTQTHATR